MRLNENEKKFIIENHKVFNSYTLLMRRFKTEFKVKRGPKHTTVKNIIEKFRKTGSIKNLVSSGRPRTARTQENIERVENMLKNNPAMSLRRISLAMNVLKESVWRMTIENLNLYEAKHFFPSEINLQILYWFDFN
jgi:uncharacterized protein YdiU (UPF0061 family)